MTRISPACSGVRATGKSAVGAMLAQKLARPFVDLDQVLEEEMGRSIADLVAAKGWPEFRRREKEMVARFGRAGGQVLATGGGAVLDPENVEVLRKNGVVVWLRADPATIQERHITRRCPEIEKLKLIPKTSECRPPLAFDDPRFDGDREQAIIGELK